DFYAQDDWKVTPRLTFNLGVRYEYNTPWLEVNGRVSNFHFGTQTNPAPTHGGLYNPDRNNFAPRVGFSYDPFGKGKTVIRGFGGISYLPLLQGAVNSLPSNNFPNVSLTVFDFPITFPVPAVLPSVAASTVNAFDPNARDSYTEQWEINIQQEILPQTVLTVGYVGNHGVKLPAGAAFAGLELNVIDINTGVRPYPGFGDERFLGNFLGSNYNSLQVGVRRRAARFTFDANYSWGHEIDNTVNIFGAFENSRNINLDHGNGDIDVRHNFTADALYDLPALHSQAAVVRGVLGDWHAATILQARSGLPFTIGLQPGVFAADPQRPNYIPGQSITPPNYSIPDSQLNAGAFSFSGPVGAVPGTVGRNSMTGPAFFQWDISMQKRFPLTEKMNLEFRSDFFNILNHPNFNNPDSTLCNSYATSATPNTCVPNTRFGQSTSTLGNLVGLGTSRQIQFALKLLW
ncbi:MAG: TonB-dependent receptor, partial [Acidobacteriia bacterium]|nr:TonB-dependent receptor [Terriglobia bacterium]